MDDKANELREPLLEGSVVYISPEATEDSVPKTEIVTHTVIEGISVDHDDSDLPGNVE